MPAHPNLHPRRGEPSGEQVFFVMAIAFWLLVAMIIFGFFLPVVVAVALIFAALAVVLAIVGVFLARLLGDD